jgi:hypothetical protein
MLPRRPISPASAALSSTSGTIRRTAIRNRSSLATGAWRTSWFTTRGLDGPVRLADLTTPPGDHLGRLIVGRQQRRARCRDRLLEEHDHPTE